MVFSRKRRRSSFAPRRLFKKRRVMARRFTKRKRTFRRKTFKRKRIPKVNSIRNTFYSTDLQDDYNLIITSKRDNLTPLLQTAFATESSFQFLVSTNTQLVQFQKCFRNARFVTLKVTLTPMVSSVVAFSDTNAKVTKIHWTNDDGSIDSFTNGALTLTLPQAKSFGKMYHEAVFDKPFTFHIKLYSKVTATSTTVSTDKYHSASQWRNTPNAAGTTIDPYSLSLPSANLFYGFTDYTSDFQYKTRYEVVVDYKNPIDPSIFS